MRAALWLVGLFSVASAVALFAGNNHFTVSIFWYPQRIDISLNLFLLLLVIAFLAVHFALRALATLFSLPHEAKLWRMQQKERAMQSMLLDAMWHLESGRFVRARKSAESLADLEEAGGFGNLSTAVSRRMKVMSHLLAARSAHALQDRAVRDSHFKNALESAGDVSGEVELREALQLRASKWAMDDRDAQTALLWLDQLPQGASRRTLALRLRFRAARLAGQTKIALDTVRQLTKHRAFSESAGASISQGLAVEMIKATHDVAQLKKSWGSLDKSLQSMPDVAMQGAERMLALQGEPVVARNWMLAIWEGMVQHKMSLTAAQKVRLVRLLVHSFRVDSASPDSQWLQRVEGAQMSDPGDALLQYLAGVVCMRLGLWGKAQQMLKHSLNLIQDPEIKRDTWRTLAELAEQRNDSAAAAEALREAARR